MHIHGHKAIAVIANKGKKNEFKLALENAPMHICIIQTNLYNSAVIIVTINRLFRTGGGYH